ncbi:PolyADP-ribose polymerase catalytic domain-containing protein, partial [Cladophialophora immunda]
MLPLWAPDPPGTINPAKLAKNAGRGPTAGSEVLDISCAPLFADAQKPAASSAAAAAAASQDALPISPSSSSSPPPPSPPPPPIPRPTVPLPRITSDWESYDIFLSESQRHRENRIEFETVYASHNRRCSTRSRRTSHYGYFRTQTQDGARIHIPPDFEAGLDAAVVIDRARTSIYDAYLLRADIMKNINFFRRHQIVFNPETATYVFVTREGRVGLEGHARTEIESSNLDIVTAKFRKIFQDKTSTTWNRRYESLSRRQGRFAFIELDYQKTAARPKELPEYTAVDTKTNEEVKDLMEHILFGGPVRSRKHTTGDEGASTSGSTWQAFTAPYEQISSWAVFSAFKTLDRIRQHIESGKAINWTTILRLSSHYRSQMPCCSGEDRPPVISSYHALFLESKFLYCLWPRREIATMAAEMHRRGAQQLTAHRALAQPLYQAYSSLRHGFRRLTDASTPEFRQLRSYLENSCHRIHCLTVELEEIYRVFVKARLPNPYRDWLEAKEAQQDGDPAGDMRLLLWHGTPLDSLLGILDLGLQIRRRGASWTGTMFGNAIYLADAASKSASFCRYEAWEGRGVLLLCEADVGVHRIRSQTSIYNGHELIRQSRGRHRCIEGLGRTGPKTWRKIEWEMEPGVGDGVPLM